MNFENQRFDFDIWGRVFRKEAFDGAPRLQPNPLAEMMRLWSKRDKGPIKYETLHRDPEALTRTEIEAAYQAVSWMMARMKVVDREAHDCLMARHARTFTDSRGVKWSNAGMPEAMIAKAMFGGSGESARAKFKRACERGYAEYQRLALAS